MRYLYFLIFLLVGCEQAPILRDLAPKSTGQKKEAPNEGVKVEGPTEGVNVGKKTDKNPETKPSKPGVQHFVGVKHLPQDHPCHDETSVLDVATVDEERVELSTLKALRKRTKDGAAPVLHARRVEGFKWSTKNVEHMVVTCEIGGHVRYYDTLKSSHEAATLDLRPLKSKRVDGFTTSHPDISGQHAYGFSGYWTRKHNGQWDEKSRDFVAHWDDSENPPWAFARMRLVGEPSTQTSLSYKTVSVHPCESRLKKCDNKTGESWPGFYAVLSSIAGDKIEVENVIMNCERKVVAVKQKANLPGRNAMMDKIRGLVREACDANVLGD